MSTRPRLSLVSSDDQLMLAAAFSNKRHLAIKSATYRKRNDGVNRQVAFALLWPNGAIATLGSVRPFQLSNPTRYDGVS
jgi:hypothetical protein